MKRKFIAFLLACLIIPSLSAGATIKDDDDKAQDKTKIEEKMEEKMKKDDKKEDNKDKKEEKKEDKKDDIKEKKEDKKEDIKENKEEKKEDIKEHKEEKKEDKKEESNKNLPKLKCSLKNNETKNILYKYEWKSDKDNSKEQKEIMKEAELNKKLTPTKVKAGDIIDLNFSEKPSKIEAEAVGKDKAKVKISDKKMEVPKCKGPHIVNIHCTYKDGSTHHAIMLEIVE